jgi:hypothetical protein
MRGVSIRSAVIAAVAAVTLSFAEGAANADPVTYNYVGNYFNFSGSAARTTFRTASPSRRLVEKKLSSPTTSLRR